MPALFFGELNRQDRQERQGLPQRPQRSQRSKIRQRRTPKASALKENAKNKADQKYSLIKSPDLALFFAFSFRAPNGPAAALGVLGGFPCFTCIPCLTFLLTQIADSGAQCIFFIPTILKAGFAHPLQKCFTFRKVDH